MEKLSQNWKSSIFSTEDLTQTKNIFNLYENFMFYINFHLIILEKERPLKKLLLKVAAVSVTLFFRLR